MKLPLELALIVSSAIAAPLAPRSAAFSQLAGLTSNSRDVSTTDKRFPDKYFHESVYHPHYDGRFADAILPGETRLFHMRLLLRSYMAAMERAGVRTWLMHGSLLGWWWNQGMFPWDSDLDFCVEETGMAELGTWWNMTVHDFTAADLMLDDASKPEPSNGRGRTGDRRESAAAETDRIHQPQDLPSDVWDTVLKKGKKYLLEVNPHYTDVSTADTHNTIDARWIDVSTGLFIDMTTIHPVPSSASAKSAEKHQIFLEHEDEPPRPAAGAGDSPRPHEMYTKDTHLYTTSSLFPLRQSRFEGTPVFVPYAYEQLLLEEYGPRALTQTWFNRYEFDAETKEWSFAPEAGVEGARKGEEDGAGRVKKQKWKPVSVEERSSRDNMGGGVYTPAPGRPDDVHVVPGGG